MQSRFHTKEATIDPEILDEYISTQRDDSSFSAQTLDARLGAHLWTARLILRANPFISIPKKSGNFVANLFLNQQLFFSSL